MAGRGLCESLRLSVGPNKDRTIRGRKHECHFPTVGPLSTSVDGPVISVQGTLLQVPSAPRLPIAMVMYETCMWSRSGRSSIYSIVQC